VKLLLEFPRWHTAQMSISLQSAKDNLNARINKMFNGVGMRVARRLMPSIQKPSIQFDYELSEGRAILEFNIGGSVIKMFNADYMIKQMQEQFDREYGEGIVSITLYKEE